MSCPFLGSRLGQGGIRKQVLHAAGANACARSTCVIRDAGPVGLAQGLQGSRTCQTQDLLVQDSGYNQYCVAKRLKVDMQVLQRFWQTFGVCWLAVMPMLGPIDP